MYSICINGHGKDKKVHEVFSNSFERSEFSSYIIKKMFDDLTGAPFFCIPDMMHIRNDDTGADSCFWFYSDECVAPSRVETVCIATAWVEGWIARDMQQLCEHEDDESDVDESGDLSSKYNELASKYNELASKYNKIASFPLIITGSENDNSIKRCKLFI